MTKKMGGTVSAAQRQQQLSRLMNEPIRTRPALHIPERVAQPTFSQVFRYRYNNEGSDGSQTFTVIDFFGARCVATSTDQTAGAADFYPIIRAYRIKRVSAWAMPGASGTDVSLSLQTGFNDADEYQDDALARVFSDSSFDSNAPARVGATPAPNQYWGRWHAIDSSDSNHSTGLFKLYWAGSPRIILDVEMEYVLVAHSPDAYNIGGYMGTSLSGTPTIGQLYALPLDLEQTGGYQWTNVGLSTIT